jgi:hypothetical protein
VQQEHKAQTNATRSAIGIFEQLSEPALREQITMWAGPVACPAMLTVFLASLATLGSQPAHALDQYTGGNGVVSIPPPIYEIYDNVPPPMESEERQCTSEPCRWCAPVLAQSVQSATKRSDNVLCAWLAVVCLRLYVIVTQQLWSGSCGPAQHQRLFVYTLQARESMHALQNWFRSQRLRAVAAACPCDRILRCTQAGRTTDLES